MASPEVVIYTTMFCPYCHSAKALLERKNVAYQEVKVDGDRSARRTMSERAGGHTSVPQVFIAGQHVGGCDDLYALDASGLLEAKLRESAS